MGTYRIAGVRRKREEGKPDIVMADLFDINGDLSLSGPLAMVISRCEERGFNVSNLEQAKAALKRMKG